MPSVNRSRVNVVELVTAVPTKYRGRFNPEFSQHLADHSIEALNRFLDIYQVLTEQTTIHHLNPENLGRQVVLEFRRHSDRPTGHFALPHLNSLPHRDRDAPAEHLLVFMKEAMEREANPHPIDLVRRLYLRAARFADTGEYAEAIESLQTSAERLVFAVHFLVLAEEGVPSADITSRLPESFSAALNLSGPLLGGNWNTSGSGAVARYWNDLYMVRNRISHVGIVPDRDAVPDAFDAYEALRSHVADRTLLKRATYPRTAIAVHGGIGLKNAGALDRRMRAVIADIDARGEQHTFWLPIDQRTAHHATGAS